MAIQKICTICGDDVSQKKRTKDGRGRYFCDPCYQQAAATISRVAPQPVQTPASTPMIPVIQPDVDDGTHAELAEPVTHPKVRQPVKGSTVKVIWSIVTLLVVGAGVMGYFLHFKTDTTRDILFHPELLLDPNMSPTDITLSGVRIGDPESAIPSSIVEKPKDKHGFIWCKGGIKFKIDDGKVVRFNMNNPEALAKLGLGKDAESNRKQIVARFGQPDRTDGSGLSSEIYSYYYDARHLQVTALGGGLAVSAEPSIIREVREFVKSCEPFVNQIQGLQARLDAGINYRDFVEKLGQVVDAYAQMDTPPSGSSDAVKFKEYADNALNSYREAVKIWGSIIEGSPVYKDRDRDRKLKDAEHPTTMLLSMFGSMKAKAGT